MRRRHPAFSVNKRLRLGVALFLDAERGGSIN